MDDVSTHHKEGYFIFPPLRKSTTHNPDPESITDLPKPVIDRSLWLCKVKALPWQALRM
jgi:hypothetical protein